MGVFDFYEVMLFVQLFGLFFKMGEMEHKAFHGVSLIPDLNGDGVILHRFLPANGLPRAVVMGAGADLGKVYDGNRPPPRRDYSEFIILFGVFQPHGATPNKHHIAFAVEHFKFDLRSLADGLQNDSEISYVLLILKRITIIILIVMKYISSVTRKSIVITGINLRQHMK